jgi:hypothetical protein
LLIKGNKATVAASAALKQGKLKHNAITAINKERNTFFIIIPPK